MTNSSNIKPKFHRDGSVTYWSVHDQAWRRSWSVPDRELAAMPEGERRKVQRRLRKPDGDG
jgi:ribosomal protein L32E